MLLLHMGLGTEPSRLSGESTTLGGTFSMLWPGADVQFRSEWTTREHPSTSRVPSRPICSPAKVAEFFNGIAAKNAQRQPQNEADVNGRKHLNLSTS